MSNFQKYSAYYDLLYRDKDYAAEAAYVARRLSAAAPGARSILDLGSGTGRHGRLLAEMGYHVHGIERSPEMVRVAGAADAGAPGSFTCTVGDVRDVRLDRRFDAVLSLFHVVSYQTSNADVLDTFRSAARHLAPGGCFLFDVWHGPAVVAQKPDVRVKRVEDDRHRLIRIAEPVWEPEANRITVHYTMLASEKETGTWMEFEEHHPMRYFFPGEIDLLAQATGFTVESSEAWLTGAPTSDATWGAAYLLRRQPG